MKSISDIVEVIGEIPYMTEQQAAAMTEHIVQHKISKVQELGFYHGVSTCYIANAASDMPDAQVVAIDKLSAMKLDPKVDDLLGKLDLRNIVTVHSEQNSYLWRLMKLIEEHPEPIFDLCYLDGAHNWFVDGFAFFLVDRLLKPGGWLIMDDVNWRYADSAKLKASEMVMNMPEEEVNCYQLRKVHELLVQRQPGYGNFREMLNWGFAQKLPDAGTVASQVRIETRIVVEERRVGIGEAMIKLGRRIGMR